MRKTMLFIISVFMFAATSIQVQAQSHETTAIDARDEDRALELAQWAMPVVSFFSMKEANERDMGAQPNQILFWSRPLDHRAKFLTPNDVTLYISTQIVTFDGPMVLEVPAAEGPLGIFGSLIDPFMMPLEDAGGAQGVDKGKGGKILITPPGYSEEIPAGYLHVPSAHYNTVAGLRITPLSFDAADIDAAIRYIKKMKLYPLGKEGQQTVFVDGANKPYHPNPPYDENFFRLLNEYVQTEAYKPRDEPFVADLSKVGIVKGKAFVADASHARIAARVKEVLQADFRNDDNRF